jgi:hypothetical protein
MSFSAGTHRTLAWDEQQTPKREPDALLLADAMQ